MKNSLRLVQEERPALRKALESGGFRVFEASVGSHDIESLRVLWAALIQFDLPMPRLGGLEVIRRLRDAGDRDPEVIILTHDRVPDTIETLRLGVVDVLIRPLKPEALQTAIEQIIHPTAMQLTSSGSAQRNIFVAVQPSLIDLLQSRRAMGSSRASRCGQSERLNPVSRKLNSWGEPEVDVRDVSD
jgi:DNA-binding response OmpR family regulator